MFESKSKSYEACAKTFMVSVSAVGSVKEFHACKTTIVCQPCCCKEFKNDFASKKERKCKTNI